MAPAHVAATVHRLFELADAAFAERPDLSTRYVHLARTLAMKHKYRLPSVFQRKFCKHCYLYIRSGVNGRVRLTNGKLVMTCFSCKKFTRFGYTAEQKQRRKNRIVKK